VPDWHARAGGVFSRKEDVSVLTERERSAADPRRPFSRRDGKILMGTDCPNPGHLRNVMAIRTNHFFKHLEEVFPRPGRHRAHNDRTRTTHGSQHDSKHGRGSVLTSDCTNRCKHWDVRPVLS